MPFLCTLSLLAAIAVGVQLFRNGSGSSMALHVLFILLVATFIASAIASIRKVLASQIESPLESVLRRSQRHGSDTRYHASDHEDRPHREHREHHRE